MTEKLIATRYRVILPEHKSFSDSEVKTVEWPREPGLDRQNEVKSLVFGKDWTEHVSVWEDFDGGKAFKALDMFVDENGLLKGLPRNELATLSYRRACMMGKTVVPAPRDPEQLNFIIGPAILFDRRVWF
jgi:hypothetical protein